MREKSLCIHPLPPTRFEKAANGKDRHQCRTQNNSENLLPENFIAWFTSIGIECLLKFFLLCYRSYRFERPWNLLLADLLCFKINLISAYDFWHNVQFLNSLPLCRIGTRLSKKVNITNLFLSKFPASDFIAIKAGILKTRWTFDHDIRRVDYRRWIWSRTGLSI